MKKTAQAVEAIEDVVNIVVDTIEVENEVEVEEADS